MSRIEEFFNYPGTIAGWIGAVGGMIFLTFAFGMAVLGFIDLLTGWPFPEPPVGGPPTPDFR